MRARVPRRAKGRFSNTAHSTQHKTKSVFLVLRDGVQLHSSLLFRISRHTLGLVSLHYRHIAFGCDERVIEEFYSKRIGKYYEFLAFGFRICIWGELLSKGRRYVRGASSQLLFRNAMRPVSHVIRHRRNFNCWFFFPFQVTRRSRTRF